MMPRQIEEWQLEDYLRALWLHKKWVIAVPLFFALFTGARMAQKPDIYRATTRILIETEVPRFFRFQEHAGSGRQEDRIFLKTEYEVIQSHAVMAQVVENLHLAAFPPFSRARKPAQMLRGMVAIEPVRGTKLVDISATGTKPELTARIADAVAETYARINLERRRNLTAGGIEWIQNELGKMEEKIQVAQRKLQGFLEQYPDVDFSPEQQSTLLQRIQALNGALTDTRKERIETETRLRPQHPKIRELQAKEQELRLALFEQEQRALEANRLSIQHNALQRELETSERLYNILLTRMKQLSVEEGLETNNVQIVDFAQVPSRPVGPPRRARTATSALLGLIIGCGLALLRELFTKTIRNRQEFEQALEIPFLGHMPLIEAKGRKKPGTRRRMKEEEPRPFLPEIEDPNLGEAIRSIRTTLEFILPREEHHTLLITSALPEEGKTVISINLAAALQELGRSVLLVDADMRRPSIHRALRLELEPGLSEFLQGQTDAEGLIKTPPAAEGLSVVTAGLTPDEPTDLLSSPQFQEQLKAWRELYQYVIIDSPPTLVAADASVLSSLASGTLLTVYANRTHAEAAMAGKQRLADVKAKITGGILNGARLEAERGYRYYYSYRDYRSGDSRRKRGKRPVPHPEAQAGGTPVEI